MRKQSSFPIRNSEYPLIYTCLSVFFYRKTSFLLLKFFLIIVNIIVIYLIYIVYISTALRSRIYNIFGVSKDSSQAKGNENNK